MPAQCLHGPVTYIVSQKKLHIMNDRTAGKSCITANLLQSDVCISGRTDNGLNGKSPSIRLSSVHLVLRCSGIIVRSPTSLVLVSLAEGRETLLLCGCVDVCANEEADNIKEWHPGMLGKELLCEGQSQRRRDPADLHDRHEAGLPGGMDLMDALCTCDDGHRYQVYGILDRSNLRTVRIDAVQLNTAHLLLSCSQGFAGSWPSSSCGLGIVFEGC